MHFNIDLGAPVWFNLVMATTTPTNTKTCGCGCGASVSRRFKPGHDGRLKGRLLKAAKSNHWAAREKAVVEMVERGWGHFLPMEVVATTKVRSRHNGRLVETRHVDSLHGVVQDEDQVSHSHWSCPTQVGRGRWTKVEVHTGWLCGTCIHTKDWSEVVGGQRMLEMAAD